jgi:transposase
LDPLAFLPHLDGFRLDAYTATAERITLQVAATTATARCPACQLPSRRIHSRYLRAVADVSWGGVPVTLRVLVRRFFCGNSACPRCIFAEPLQHLVDRYARRTRALRVALQRIGLALGGAAGARLAGTLGLPVGRTTLLDLIRAVPPLAGGPLRIVGIDEWAWRRGHRFGTILVDLERHRVVELLAERSADSAAAWLRQQPGITAVVRDRSGLYADAASRGAPGATQIADRWHLVHSLTEGLEAFLLQQRAALRAASAVPDEGTGVASADMPGPLTPLRPRCGQRRAAEASRQRHARRVEQYEAIRRLHAAGADVADIARCVGTSRRTVYRYRDLPEPPVPKRPHRPPHQRMLTPYEPYVLQRWHEGCHNGMRLYREIRAQGYAYGASNVMRFVAQLRRDEADGRPAGASRRAKAAPTPTARHVAGLFLRRPADLSPEQRVYLDRLHQADATLATAYRLTQDFAAMVRERQGERLEAWLAEAEACALPALTRFAKGVRADLDAVRAGLTEAWSNGPTEGFVHKLKLLKRQGYGRAGFDLLRQRMIAAA